MASATLSLQLKMRLWQVIAHFARQSGTPESEVRCMTSEVLAPRDAQGELGRACRSTHASRRSAKSS